MSALQTLIEQSYDEIIHRPETNLNHEVRIAVDEVIAGLNQGELRVAEKKAEDWHVNQWIKQAILLYFRLHQNTMMAGGFTQFYDKVPLKYSHSSESELSANQVRMVPPAVVRTGCYVAPNTVLMPSFINIGAYVDSGCMIDTWATVGSCAQIGKNVHLSGGAGIGGVLEPLQANPTIVEDNCFIGARSEIVEGVIVESGAVISMGVFISQSTRIYDREQKTVSYGRVPAGAVVVPGSLPAADGSHSLACAVIVKRVDEQTKQKVGINALLREVDTAS